MPEDIRGWLAEALGRRTQRPALEQTLSHQLDALERGPLEQLGELVRAVVDELRLAQQRLNEQAADLRALRATVAALSERMDAAAAPEPAPQLVAPGHVLLLSTSDGYRLAERNGPPPEPGETIAYDGCGYAVLGRGRSPLPGDRRPCLLALSTWRDASDPATVMARGLTGSRG
jgi:hypothetical protein